MKFVRGRLLHIAAGAASVVFAVALSGHNAWPQTTKTIKIVVPSPPGGITDLLARLMAEQISQMPGRTMVVENRPGAGTEIGTEAVSRAAADGNTVLIATPTFVVNPHFRKLNYDPLASFEPICHLVTAPNVIVVNSASPYRTLANLLEAARTKPGTLTLASVGPASATQLGFEILKRAAQVDMTFVPFPGNAPAVNALLGEHVTSFFGNYSDVAEQVKAGTLRALAIASHTRAESLPDLPTIAESGYKDYELEFWIGVVAPARTPKETLSQLAGWLTTAVQVPEVKTKLAIQGLSPAVACGAEFIALLRKEYDKYGRIIREANIKAE
jgi:tripartite-type tricarboxylate transporter receptor subunit TctC